MAIYIYIIFPMFHCNHFFFFKFFNSSKTESSPLIGREEASYSFAKVHSLYSTAPANWVGPLLNIKKAEVIFANVINNIFSNFKTNLVIRVILFIFMWESLIPLVEGN